MRGVLIGFDEERDTAAYDDQNVEDDVGLCHLFHPVRGKRVNQACKDGERSHHAYSLPCRRIVAEVASD